MITGQKEKQFKEALKEESEFPLSDSIYDFLTKESQLIKVAKNGIIMDYGEVEKDIFLVYEGVVRGVIKNDNGLERTVGFGLTGTLISSAQCYSKPLPSIYRYTACCPSLIFKLSKEKFDQRLDIDHEFCKWVLGNYSLRLYYSELRNENLNGDAKFKYKWLEEKRPEILRLVSDKIIASYLNITEVHLSRIKRELLKPRDDAK